MPLRMGQSVSVVRKRSSNPGVLRFEINRSLTGMGHERYRSPADVILDRPVDVLARRIFEHGGVDGIHVNSSVITIDLSGGNIGDGIEEVIRDLFRFYPASEDVPVEGPPVEAVAEPDAAVAPESAVDDETRAEGSLADRTDAPAAADPDTPTPDPATPTGIDSDEPDETDETPDSAAPADADEAATADPAGDASEASASGQ
jgi:hypothetical protein